MYSTTPIPDPNLDHVGFYVLLALLTLFGAALIGFLSDGEPKEAKIKNAIKVGVVWVALLVFPFYKSFIQSYPVPKNTQVVATRVGFGEKMGSGKYPTMNSQVMYNTPDGVVSFGMGNGQPWADTVILYKNQ